MKNMKLIYFVIFITLFSYPLFSQQNSNSLEAIIPPSPSVAELTKYTTIPVSPYSGIPEISIKIGELRSGDIVVPISLSYHAGGIQVDQVSSNVGLGWSLNAGGVISQTMFGKDDLSASRTTMSFEDIQNNTYLTPSVINSLPESTLDTEPDIFSYNFTLYSGQFILDKDNSFYNIRGLNDLSFNRFGGGLLCKDLKGHSYYFQENETSTNTITPYNSNFSDPYKLIQVGTSSVSPLVPTGYYLTKIIAANKQDFITLGYTNESIKIVSKVNGSIYYDPYDGWREQGGGAVHHLNDDQNDVLYGTIPTGNFTISQKEYKAKKIAEIKNSNGAYFAFIYDNADRLDLVNSKSLQEIKEYNSSGQNIRNWKFIYDYFISEVKTNETTTELRSQNYRMKLVSITEIGVSESGEEKKRTYKFDYYGDRSNERQMPYRNALSGSDYWGYCNGKTYTLRASDIRCIFPQINELSYLDNESALYYGKVQIQGSSLSNKLRFATGESKEINAEYLKTYSLRSITYPTGGKSEFIYEPHLLGNNLLLTGGQRIKEIRHYMDNDNYTFQKYLYEIGDGIVIDAPHFLQQTMLNIQFRENPALMKKPYLQDIFLKLSSTSLSPSTNWIGYKNVIEITGDGKTVYTYSSTKSLTDQYAVYYFNQFEDGSTKVSLARRPILSLYSRGSSTFFRDPITQGYFTKTYGLGHLLEKSYYNKNNELLVSEKYTYDIYKTKNIYGMIPYKISSVSSPFIILRWPKTILSVYYNELGKAVLKNKTVIEYYKNKGGIFGKKISEKYTYNKYDLITETKTILNNTDSLSRMVRYASDIDSPIYKDMSAINMVNYPIETIEKRNNKIIAASLTTYKSLSTFFLPDNFYKAKSINSSTYKFFDGSSMDSRYENSEYFLSKYDEMFNIREIILKNGMKSVYVWNTLKQLIAEIKNIGYDDIYLVWPKIQNKNLATNDVDELRNILPDAMITTYSYSRYGTVSAVKGPDGVSKKYEYNPLGQLQSIKDFNDNIISAFRYKYANE